MNILICIYIHITNVIVSDIKQAFRWLTDHYLINDS